MAKRWLLCLLIASTLATACLWAFRSRHHMFSLAPGIREERVKLAGLALRVVRVRLDQARIDLKWRDQNDTRIGTLASAMSAAGERSVFATNAGIFDRSFAPLGVHIENGQLLRPLNLEDGAGNFFWKPNAVFFIRDGNAGIVRADQFDPAIQTEIATQSGPMLIEHGKVFDSVTASTSSWRTRSGVGVTRSGEVIFALSAYPCSFASFANAFAALDCPNAMYLDGQISAFRTKEQSDDGDFAGIFVISTRE